MPVDDDGDTAPTPTEAAGVESGGELFGRHYTTFVGTVFTWLLWAASPGKWGQSWSGWILVVFVGLWLTLTQLVAVFVRVRKPVHVLTPSEAFRRVDALTVLLSVLGLVGLFSAMYLQLAGNHNVGPAACFSVPVKHHLDTLYFTVGILTTAGTGALQPMSQVCRRVVTLQMATGVAVIGIGLSGFVARLLERD